MLLYLLLILSAKVRKEKKYILPASGRIIHFQVLYQPPSSTEGYDMLQLSQFGKLFMYSNCGKKMEQATEVTFCSKQFLLPFLYSSAEIFYVP